MPTAFGGLAPKRRGGVPAYVPAYDGILINAGKRIGEKEAFDYLHRHVG
jgi:hypothetical protein